MNRSRSILMGLILAILTVCFIAPDVNAMPGFARKYKISCKTCHAPFPRLKPYGDEFAGRGFRMEPGQEPSRATYDVGDPTLLLMREIPLGARFEGFASWKVSYLIRTMARGAYWLRKLCSSMIRLAISGILAATASEQPSLKVLVSTTSMA